MQLTSPAFENNNPIPAMYTCEGQGSMPPLHIADVSENAKSLVLIVDDPDAPVGTFVHYLLWNIPPETTQLEEGTLPGNAVEGNNSSGELGWIAPCPPSGIHHYRFMLSALSTPLDLPAGTDRNTLEKRMEDVVIARAELVGTYSRDFGGAAAEEGLPQ